MRPTKWIMVWTSVLAACVGWGRTPAYIGLLLIHQRIGAGDTSITLLFFPGFHLVTGKKGRFLYVFDRAGINLLQDDFLQSLVI